MKTVVITGSTRGLGRALATEFARRGYQVFGTARNASDAQNLETEFGPPHRFHTVDTTNPAGLVKLAEEVGRCGPIDLVIANAGAINTRKPVWAIPRDVWELNLSVNLQGMINTIQAFLPAMIEADHGTFIGMSSGWGRSPSRGLGPYCASKFAVEGLIGCLVLDLAEAQSAVTAIALDPGGGINTDMLADCLPEEHGDFRSAGDWAPGAVRYIETALIRDRVQGSQEVPESAHDVGEA